MNSKARLRTWLERETVVLSPCATLEDVEAVITALHERLTGEPGPPRTRSSRRLTHDSPARPYQPPLAWDSGT
ncbi:hypothetical protein [Streptomyces sp. BH055]|uniref:hypothetical protein n=1 Tax=Streptomyces sp. BH055 TaxID=3401173 RepID=UPI003BB6A961